VTGKTSSSKAWFFNLSIMNDLVWVSWALGIELVYILVSF